MRATAPSASLTLIQVSGGYGAAAWRSAARAYDASRADSLAGTEGDTEPAADGPGLGTDDIPDAESLPTTSTTLGELHHAPDRLRAPIVRAGSDWREVSWDEAFDVAERKIRGVIDTHGIAALTAYIGHPAALSYWCGYNPCAGIVVGGAVEKPL